MGLNCFPKKQGLVALAISLTLFGAVYAEDAPAPAGESAPPAAAPVSGQTGTGTASGGETKTSTEAQPSRTPEAKADPKKAAELEKGIIEANAQPGSRAPEPRASAAQSRPSGAVKLYGRIEELTAGTGAKIPLKMVAMTPVRDSSYDQKPTKLAGKANTTTLSARTNLIQSFPIDYRGSWTGGLTINSVNFDPTYFQWDRAEAEKEARMIKPGMKGNCTVNFFQGNDNKIQAEPTQVTFQGTDTLAGSGGLNSGQMGSLANNPMFANMGNMQVPVMFSLHLGAPIQAFERGVTGNQLNKELMKNTLRELSKVVLEQQVVTKDSDRQPNGRTRVGYSESVLRFTRISATALYLQAAYVYYKTDGKFQAKYILYGTLNRSNGYTPSSPTNPYGTTMVNPFGGMMPGMGGGQGGGQGGAGMQDAAKALQKMMQQMGGR